MVNMYCPACGNPDQPPETFCRRCGIFLPDLSKPVKGPVPPQQHLSANLVLGSMTVVVCFVLAALLLSLLAFKPETNPLIYVTSGLLIAMGCWHVQTVWRTILLKKHFRARNNVTTAEDPDQFQTGKLLDRADFSNVVPASVTEDETTKFDRSKIPSAQS